LTSPFLNRIQLESQRNRVADAYLLLGNSRIRLRSATEEIAGFLLSTPTPMEHPDFAVLDPAALGIHGLKVEHIAHRKEGVESVESLLRFRPSEGDSRIVALYEADRMGPDAQAALLKTAEEPPAGTTLLLTAQDSAQLLPALLSRCRIHRVPSLTSEEQLRRAASMGLEDSDYLILQSALGNTDAPLELSTSDRQVLLSLYQGFREWVADPSAPMPWLCPPEGGKLAEQREDGQRRLGAILGWIAELYPQLPSGTADRLDRTAQLHLVALADIRGQITPGVVFEDLAAQCEAAVTSDGQGL